MKTILASILAIALVAAAIAPEAKAAPVLPGQASAAYGGFVQVGVGAGGPVYAQPYWGITGYRTDYQTVFLGYDAWGRPLYTSQPVTVAVYGWIYPSGYYAPRYHYRPYWRPHFSIGLGFRL